MNRNTINRLVAGSIPAGPTFSLLLFRLGISNLRGMPAVLSGSEGKRNNQASPQD